MLELCEITIFFILLSTVFSDTSNLKMFFRKEEGTDNVNESEKIFAVNGKIFLTSKKFGFKVDLFYYSESKQNNIVKSFTRKMFKRNSKRYDYDILSTISKLAKLLIDRYNQKILINSEELAGNNRLQISIGYK